MVSMFYTTNISVELAHSKIFRAEVCNVGINKPGHTNRDGMLC